MTTAPPISRHQPRGANMKDRINIVADLLMGAAHADGRLEGMETTTVKRLLREILGQPSLPMDLEFRLEEFNPRTFDLGEAGAAFVEDSPADKRHLLELISTVQSTDGEFDLAEDAYLRRVGLAIGLPEGHYRDLAAAVLEDRALGLSREMPALRLGGAPKTK
jgi:uncharacterized tellurite resistance protein B-like protein